jgi:Notch-like protein
MCDDEAAQCGDHGHCADPYVTDACECDPTHMGDACDELVPFCVADDPNYGCMNGGVCEESEDRTLVPDIAGMEWVIVGATTCNCEGTAVVDGEEVYSGDFRGAHCEIPAPCNNNPCLNGGVCVNGDYQDYTCDCADATTPTSSPISGTPFTGDHCEFPTTSVCDYEPCENGGECEVDESEPGEYKCTCVDGWEGETCTVAPTNGCDQQDETNTCLPYGHCITGSDPDSNPPFTHCVCSYGYSGEFCKDAPKACESVDCQNGGSCIGFATEAQEAWACLCQEPWVGQNCQWNATYEATKAGFDTKI